jgi:polyphosphate kinase 2 (PPK2 family)
MAHARRSVFEVEERIQATSAPAHGKAEFVQQLHYASHRYALLLIFQGIDGAGKGVELPLRIDSKQVIENTRR